MVLPRLPISVMAMGKYQLIPEDKIAGGEVVSPNWAPFQISLQRKSGNIFSHSCGGSILDSNVILDAAHCVRKYYLTKIIIVNYYTIFMIKFRLKNFLVLFSLFRYFSIIM